MRCRTHTFPTTAPSTWREAAARHVSRIWERAPDGCMWPLPEWSRLTDEADELAYLMARAADASRADVSGMTDDQILEHFGFRKVMDGCECQMPPAAVAAEIAPIVPIETVFDPGHWSHWRRHVEVAIWLEAAGLARRRIAGLRERATTARSRHR